MQMLDTTFILVLRGLWVCLCLGLLPSTVLAEPVTLQCELFAGGQTYRVVAEPTTSLYHVTPLDLERFRFKALVFGDNEQWQYIKVQVYYRTGPEAILLHQVKYVPPIGHSTPLGGTHYVYSPDLGHELVYHCNLEVNKP